MTTYSDDNSCSVCKNIGLMGLMLISFILAAFTNWYLAADGDTGAVNEEYSLNIMPSDWTFVTMWSINYGLQFVWMLYLFILTMRFANRESLFHSSFYIFFIIANFGNASLVYFWNHAGNGHTHNVLFASLSCIVIDLCLYMILFQAMRTLLSPVSSGQLPDWVTSAIRKLLVLFCINGVAFYLGWVSFTCNLDLALALKWVGGVGDTEASFVALVLLLLFIILYTTLNYLWIDMYLARIYTVYPALIIALTGVASKQGVYGGNPASVMSFTLLCLCVVLYVLKIAINCIKAKKRSENYGMLDYGYDMASI